MLLHVPEGGFEIVFKHGPTSLLGIAVENLSSGIYVKRSGGVASSYALAVVTDR
jgi:hypothetical protein